MNLEPLPSPTGSAVLPQWAVRAASILVAIAGTTIQFLEPDSMEQRVAAFIVALGAAFGIVSQGVRR